MDKRIILGFCTGMVVMALVIYQPLISEAIYSIPPTDAYKTVSIANNILSIPSTDTNVTAINYHDNFWLITDGSIILNITTYP